MKKEDEGDDYRKSLSDSIFHTIAELIEKNQPSDQWISVGEATLTHGKWYLIVIAGTVQHTAYQYLTDWWAYDEHSETLPLGEVTHVQLFPEAPKSR